MNIQEYKIQVQRTMPDLGSKILNSIHMTLGIASESLEELNEAIEKKDRVNIAEELADTQWYLLNYATLHGIEILDPEFRTVSFDKALGFICDLDKKELAYGKVTESSNIVRVRSLRSLIGWTEFVAINNNIDMDSARQKVINKLMLRYPDKFDADKAINRDTDAERKVLEEEQVSAEEIGKYHEALKSTQPTTLNSILDKKDHELARPPYYGGEENPYEPIKIIEYYNLGFSMGNVVKYALRLGKKDEAIKELTKIIQYATFELNRIKRENNK